MTTIVEVARRAGVSVSTVSHVLNGTRRVSAAKAASVRAAIDTLDYRPNIVARSLRTTMTRSVGVAISSISNPYFSDIICAVESECARLGFLVFLSDTEDKVSREVEIIQAFRQRSVDGIVLAPSPDPDRRALAGLRATGIPCVLVDRMIDPRFDQIGVDNRAAMQRLIDHVVARGHRRIGYLGGQPGFETTIERIDGYRDALANHGIAFDERLLVAGNWKTDSAKEGAERLLDLDDPPTVLVGGNNLSTIGIMKALHGRGLRVPRDVSVVGFDDFEWADCFEPRLTLVAQPCGEIGRQAAALLMERIAQPDGAPRTLRLAATIVERDSCRRPG